MPETKEKNMKEIFEEIEALECVVRKGLLLLDEFIAGPMCGRCLPCPMGSYEMRLRLKRLADGEGTEADVEAVRAIAPKMLETSMCKKGKDTARFFVESLEKLQAEYSAHAGGACPARECTGLQIYRVIPRNCTMCGNCLDVCKDAAVIGEKKVPYRLGYLPFEIADKRCSRCGECIKVCKDGAIEIVDVAEMSKAGT